MRRPPRLLHDRDTWLRHELVAQLLDPPPDSVLDVGGIPGRLSPHLPNTSITAVNVESPADVLFDGNHLPFEDTSFDAVVSIDVLEHLEQPARAGHVTELTRVASRQVVLCCPIASPGHAEAERELADTYATLRGTRERYLDEHLTNGLPTESELRALFENTPAKLFFNGNYRTQADLFRLGALAALRTRPIDRLRFLSRRLRTPLDRTLRPTPGPTDNRAFINLTLIRQTVAGPSPP